MGYRSAGTRSKVVIGLLIGAAAIDALALLSTLSQLSLLNHAVAGQAPTHAAAVANDMRQMLLGVFQGLMIIPTVIAFCMWLHRAYANLEGLRYTAQQYTPGWAVGWFFVPFLNLVRPFQVMREIWNASRPILDDGSVLATTEAMRMNETPAPVSLWWGMYLLSGFVGQVSFRLTLGAKTIPAMITGTWSQVASDAAGIASALLAILVVRTVTRMQEERFALISAAPTPPDAESVPPGTSFEAPGVV